MDEKSEPDIEQQMKDDAKMLRQKLYDIFKRDQEIIELMERLPNSWLASEFLELDQVGLGGEEEE